MYSYQLKELGALGFVSCALLGTFCAFRLARFNVKVNAVHGYFEGLPCPTVGVIIASYVLSGVKIWNWAAMFFGNISRFICTIIRNHIHIVQFFRIL